MLIDTPLTPRTPRANAICQGAAATVDAADRAHVARENTHDDVTRTPVWNHVISRLLAGLCGDAETEADVAPKRPRLKRPASEGPSRHVQIEVLERLSDTTVAVWWQDATRCQYVDQVWIFCRARIKGRCALSGATIRRGDPVYTPRVRNAVPVNAGAMIVASLIAHLPSAAPNDDVC